MHILEKIVLHKRKDVADAKFLRPLSELQQTQLYKRECNSFIEHLNSPLASGVIAEFKRKSPSKSAINLGANLNEIILGYKNGGVGAISILTDEHFFGGSNQFLTEGRQLLPYTPLLRKDFIIDEYQIHEAKAIGADIILLICEILTAAEIRKFSELARSLGMEILLELHSEDQLHKYCESISYVGVNNRDLTTFTVDYDRSKDLFNRLPANVPKIAESGLSNWETVVMLYQHGFRGFLIGEQFMKQEDPGHACSVFIKQYMEKRSHL